MTSNDNGGALAARGAVEPQGPGPSPAGAAPVLWVVVPCYNEEEVLPITAPRFKA